jgi:HEPN domain-containing protein
MQNRDLAADYLKRASIRLEAVQLLLERQSYADVVRESQEVVELALKALLRSCGILPPRIHDVSDILESELDRLPSPVKPHVERLTDISRSLRRDRELAFYGTEDLTPSAFYKVKDAKKALEDARFVVATVAPHVATG